MRLPAFILLLCFSCVALDAQTVTTDASGAEIVVFPDGSWRYVDTASAGTMQFEEPLEEIIGEDGGAVADQGSTPAGPKASVDAEAEERARRAIRQEIDAELARADDDQDEVMRLRKITDNEQHKVEKLRDSRSKRAKQQLGVSERRLASVRGELQQAEQRVARTRRRAGVLEQTVNMTIAERRAHLVSTGLLKPGEPINSASGNTVTPAPGPAPALAGEPGDTPAERTPPSTLRSDVDESTPPNTPVPAGAVPDKDVSSGGILEEIIEDPGPPATPAQIIDREPIREEVITDDVAAQDVADQEVADQDIADQEVASPPEPAEDAVVREPINREPTIGEPDIREPAAQSPTEAVEPARRGPPPEIRDQSKYARYARERDPRFNPPARDCAVVEEGVDEFTQKRRRALGEFEFFTYTSPQLRPVLKDKSLITAIGRFVSTGDNLSLEVSYRIRSQYANQEFGVLARGSELGIKLVGGGEVTLRNAELERGSYDPVDKVYIFNGRYSVSSTSEKALRRELVDKVRVVWGSGFEDYPVYDVAVLAQQLKCL